MSGASLPTIEGYKLNEAEYVLIPDEWGKSSDEGKWKQCMSHPSVLIPDEWGKSSDTRRGWAVRVRFSLNPR